MFTIFLDFLMDLPHPSLDNPDFCPHWSEDSAMMLRFRPNEDKALEALVFVASEWPRITPFFVAKVLYFAEKEHLNRYGRPITADTYIAMEHGPVPSRIRDYIEGNYLFYTNADKVSSAISVDKTKRYAEISAIRPANLDVFSRSDIECLRAGLEKCRGKDFLALRELVHNERAWIETDENSTMDYGLFIDEDNPDKEEILREAEEYAAFGVT